MPRSTIELTLRRGDGQPVRYRFAGDGVTIGRSPDCDLVIPDPELSRVHARLERAPDGRWQVRDAGSRNGTLLNGIALGAGASRVGAGDEIGLGDAVLVVELPDSGSRSGVGPARTTAAAGAPAPEPQPVLVGSSAEVAAVRAAIARMAPSDKTVLITGESGTGKELVAQLLHRRSPRAPGPFVIINCPALAPALQEAELFGVEKGVATGVEARIGRFEAAKGGSVFLDEIGDMELGAQAKILRALQARSIERVGGRRSLPLDVRVIAATHHDLEADVAAGRFRADLYHRLRVLAIHLPPLRERREDIVPLAEHFLAAEGGGHRLGEDAKAALVARDFPGNVRELEHLMASAVVAADGPILSAAHLSAAGVPVATPAARPPSPEQLLARIVTGGESFWDVVHGPYLRRELSREVALALVRRAYEQGGHSYRGVARLLRIEHQYQKLFAFLKNHDLRVKR